LAILEVPWFVGLPTREDFVKIFSTEASVAPQTVASQHVIDAEVSPNLHVRTAAESPAGIENAYAQESAKPSSSKARQERDELHPRADAIAGDPAHAREQIEAAKDQVTQAIPAGDAAWSGREQALGQERRRIDALAQDLAALRKEIEAIEIRLAAASAAHIEAAQSGRREQEVAAVTDGTGAAVPPVRAIDKDRIALFARTGEDFIAAGDFVGARLVFRRAAELGDARATLRLAATYDPNPLELFRVNGLPVDFAKGRFWYDVAMLSALPSRREASNLWPAVQWPKAEVLDGS
jgi:hypothetical protein